MTAAERDDDALPMTTAELAAMVRRLHHAPKTPRDHLANARALRAIEHAVDELLRESVAGARDRRMPNGMTAYLPMFSWAQIGIALGISPQGARQRFARWVS